MSDHPIKLTIAALGGQGGGVLTDWLIDIAETNAWLVQSTSVPGVAQRTGATIYYLEFLARAQAETSGREPVMALMPVAGDVDCVVASELAEGARAIQRGLVTRDRTTLIASTHRSYTIAEKSAMGRGLVDSAQLLELVRSQGKRSILFDMQATAERHYSVISAVLLGAICAAGVLPFSRDSFEAAIRKSGLAVKTNLAAFADAFEQAQQVGVRAAPVKTGQLSLDVPTQARTPALQPTLDRIRRLPAVIQPVVLEGTRRMLDYQDPAYAALFLDRVEAIAALDFGAGNQDAGALTEATARGLALWMSFEDTIRVAQLKTRPARFERVCEENHASPGQLFGITEFLRPRVAEIAGTLPRPLGLWVLRSPRVCRWLGRRTSGWQIRTKTISGFVFLHAIAGLRGIRRSTLRFHEENARIEGWLGQIGQLAVSHYALAVELARAQRLIKGYGETHERGWRNFCELTAQLELLCASSEGAAHLARLTEAALADEDGSAFAREIAALSTGPSVGVEVQKIPA